MNNAALPRGAGIVIVGGGLAGLQLAKELDRRGTPDVLVVEAGPAGDLSHINQANTPEAALRMWLDTATDPYFWRPWASKSAPHYDETAGLRRRLGGRSLYWHGVSLPIESWALREPWWPEAVVRDLTESWQGGPGLYDRIDAEIEEWRGGERDPGAGLPELTVGAHRFSPTPQAVRGHAWSNGERWSAYSPVDHWRDPAGRFAGQDSSIRIATGVQVLGVRVTGGRARGVIVQGGPGVGEMEIAAESVVLAAGTIENSRLALQALWSAGKTEEDTLHGLSDHLVHGFVAYLHPESTPVQIRAAAETDSFYFTPCAERARSNLFLRVYTNSAGAVVFDAWTMGEQLPAPTGLVQCVATGEWPWQTYVQAKLSDDDHEVVAAQRDGLNTLWADLCAAMVRPVRELEFPVFDEPASTLATVLPGLDGVAPGGEPVTWSGPLGSEYHEGGTLPLGRVLDDRQQLRDLPGLYAAGPSIFPRPGAANPSKTSLALSNRLAALLPS